MTNHLPVSQLSALAILSMAASLTAQSLLPTKGQIIAQPGDTAIGLATGEVFGGTSPFDTPVMSANGLTLFRGTLTGGSVGTFDNRALFVGHTHADLKVLVRTNQLDPSNTFPNSVLVQLSSGSGLPLSSNLFSNQRISPNGTFLMFPAQLYDGGNPGADGLNHAQTGVTIPANDTVMYWVTGTSFLILARQNITTMVGGAVLSSAMTGAFSHQATALNSTGTAIFKSDLAGGDVVGTDNNTAWVIGGPGNLQWDAHSDIEENHLRKAAETDQPVAALLTDLKQRGLLDETLVLWGGEFGRSPEAESGKGRDHHNLGFTMWLAGGGIRGGQVIGATDAIGLKAVEQPHHFRDIHTTILHQLGLDQHRLTYPHLGRNERLTFVEGSVIQEII